MARLMLAAIALLVSEPARAGENYLSIGLGGGPEDAWNWQTLTWTPFKAAGETGLIVRGSLKAEAKTYVTDIPARDDARIWVSGIGLDGELGWQVAGDWGQAAVLAGVAWRDYTLSPDDPNSKLGANQLHARVSAQGHLVGGENWGGFWYGDYVSGVNEWFAEARPYYQLGSGPINSVADQSAVCFKASIDRGPDERTVSAERSPDGADFSAFSPGSRCSAGG